MKWAGLKDHDSSLEFIRPVKGEGEVLGISGIEEPLPHHLVFVKNSKILSRLAKQSSLRDFSSSGIIFESSFWQELSQKEPARAEELLGSFGVLAKTPDVMLSMCLLSRPFYENWFEALNHYIDGRQMGTADIDPTAFLAQGVFVGDNVKIGPGVRIHPGSVIMSQVEIGEGTVLFPHVTLYPGVKLGRNCRVHSGSVLGADGFGYYFHQGVHHKIWHRGGVIIEDDVEIGANSAVDGGTFSPTIVGKGTRLDNFVQVGHNCRLGKGVVLCGHVAIGGSSHIGDYCVFGGKAGMGSDMTLGKGCQVAGGALVNCDWPDGTTLGGHPARPLKEWMQGLAYVRRALDARKKGHSSKEGDT